MSQDTTGTPEATGPDAVTPDATTTPAVGAGGTVTPEPSGASAAPVDLDEPVAPAPLDPAPVAPAPVAPAPVASLDDDVALAPVAVAAVPVGPGLGSRLAAEAFGTLFLVIAGLGTALYANITGLGGGPLAVALAFGLALLAGAVAVGYVSGGHFNPAVTLGAAIAGRTSWKDVLPYWLAQLVGAVAAAAVLFVTLASFPTLAETARTYFSSVANGYGTHSPIGAQVETGEGFALLGALLIEVVMTAIFVGVILGSTDRRSTNSLAPAAIGFALVVGLLVTIPMTNGSLNPARSSAAAVFSESWAFGQLWLFWVAPLLGAALAGLLYRAFGAEPVQDDLLGEDDVVVLTGDEAERAL
ncbi:aquaporin [Cellulomonas cellasea]|uniref:Aquaporin Z n=1 Tax=Cellulomonas cellasea TaxID=43670 RepID=A0A7W4UEE8_9CELL|nr:aquaporin [Cellulomonas cellasea]MBB2922662.1 aquaporin Z [Cellulomonas cellasea]